MTSSELPPAILTSSMQELIQRRLRKVDAQYHEMQKLAAVIGRELDLRLLQQHFDASRVEAWLTDASNAAVLEVQDNIWRFSYNKLREVILAGLTEAEKPTLHRNAAETIEIVYPNDIAYNEALMNHWREAGDLDKELYYLDFVARQMIEIKVTLEAVQTMLQRALQQIAPDDARRVLPLNNLAKACWLHGQYAEAVQYAENARLIAMRVNDEKGLVQSFLILGHISLLQGEYERATEFYQQHSTLCQKIGDQLGVAYSLTSLGTVAMYQGEYEKAAQLYQQSLTIGEQLGDQVCIIGSRTNLGIIAMHQGEYERAVELHTQNLTLYKKSGNQRGIASALFNLGRLFHIQGREDAITYTIKGLQQAYDIAVPLYQLYNLTTLVAILHSQGDLRRSGELIGLVKNHPLTIGELLVELDKVLPQLEATMPPDELAAALERGKALDLYTVVPQLLVEFAPSEED